MRRVLTLILLLGTLLATACAAPISANLAAPRGGPLQGVIAQGLQDATFNLDEAVRVGALDMTDPAPGCFHGILTQLGIDPANLATVPSFVPKVSDLISAGSVAYIRLHQAKRAQGGLTLPIDCRALLGQFFLDAAHAARETLPGAGLRLLR